MLFCGIHVCIGCQIQDKIRAVQVHLRKACCGIRNVQLVPAEKTKLQIRCRRCKTFERLSELPVFSRDQNPRLAAHAEALLI
jgi:hypothetical protein